MAEKCLETNGDLDEDTRNARAATRAEELVKQDEFEPISYGQKVRDAFEKADYYVDSDETGRLSKGLERFLKLVFDEPFISPSVSEVAMAHAYMAGLRSADLSRQVGAAIVGRDGQILTTGCNDVPRPGGGQYWPGDADDARDFKHNEDLNDRKKKEAFVELLGQIDDLLRGDLQGDPRHVYNKELKSRLKGTRFDALLEFSRAVHAEMAAMNAAAIEMISIRDADLYCTTFPCHMCARQIINTGIRNVFYIEPYPKSLTGELFGEAVDINPNLGTEELERRFAADPPATRTVAFIPFCGVAPRRYGALFSNKKRKNDEGSTVPFVPETARPRRAPIAALHLQTEVGISARMNDAVARWIAGAGVSQGQFTGSEVASNLPGDKQANSETVRPTDSPPSEHRRGRRRGRRKQ